MGTRTTRERSEDVPPREILNTHSRYQAFSSLETARQEDDETETPIYVLDKLGNGKRVREETVVDSSAAKCATSRKRPSVLRVRVLRVSQTPESRRGTQTWTCAGGTEIQSEGAVTVNWRTGLFLLQSKIGPAPLTSTSVDRLPETGYDVILAKSPQRRVNMTTRRDLAAEKREKHMLILDMWIWVPTSRSRAGSCSSFCTTAVKLPSGSVQIRQTRCLREEQR